MSARIIHIGAPPPQLRRVLAVSALVAGAAVAIAWSASGLGPYQSVVHMPWWILAALFLVTETHVAHVQFRRQTQTFSLTEVPLVLGLFFSAPVELVVGQLIGSALALILHRRQPLEKWVFNLSHFALSSGLAVLVFRAIARPGAGAFFGAEHAAAFAATAVAIMVGTLAVLAAVSLTEGLPAVRSIYRSAWFGGVTAATNTCLALLAVELLEVDARSAWLLVAPAAVLMISYRGYTSHRRQHETLLSLSDVTREVQASLDVDIAMRTVLEHARRMFRADLATITFLPRPGEDLAFEARLGPGEDLESLSAITLDPTQGVWARVAAEGRGVVLPRPIENARLREHFAQMGMRDVMVAPLRGREGVIGVVRVANRTGDVETFSAGDLVLLEAFVNHVGVALDNVRLMSELHQTVGDLTVTDRLKEEVLATLSHELRSPLAALRMHIEELLLEDAIDDEQRRAHTTVMAAQSERLRVMIEDLLMDARLTADAVTPYPVKVHPAELLDGVARWAQAWQRDHPLRIATEAGGLPPIYTDADALHMILANLVGNAAKHSPAGTPIVLRASREDGGVLFEVEDHGPGIPAELHERIFDRFFQVRTEGRRTSGVGLGLSICRRLADSLGGRVWVARSQPRAGTTFALWVPPVAPTDAATAVAPERMIVLSDRRDAAATPERGPAR